MGKPFFAYMLRCADASYYMGHTDDLEKRVAEYQAGEKCAYTFERRPVRLMWSQEFWTREEAKDAEARIKKWSRAKKEGLVRGDRDAVRQAARKNWDLYHKRKKYAPRY